MSPAPVVEVEGAKELRKSLKAAGETLSDMGEANQRVGNLVASAARPITPRQTGALAGSIRAAKAAGGVTLRAGSASIRWAGPIHWGWPARNIPANPYLMNAAINTEPTWVALYQEEMTKIVDTVRGKGF